MENQEHRNSRTQVFKNEKPRASGAGYLWFNAGALSWPDRRRMPYVSTTASGIAEGSQASGTSKKTELKLTNVARASLEELRLDYEDFLRQRGLCQWPHDDLRRKELISRRPASADDVAAWVKKVYEDGHDGQNGQYGQKKASIKSSASISSSYAEIACNAALVLIGVASSLLDRQLATQAEAFEKEGGFTERLYRIRKQSRRTS
ncbi:MAG: four helix bundle suffix domain-containing protein [Sedimentisphaerales bacterium]|nr:four helix bundle suffix domain-containing protein [Sedimentisphaerales bacterium]